MSVKTTAISVSNYFHWALFSLLIVATMALPGWGATITVNDPADVVSPTDGRCTLREAIHNANLLAGGDTTGTDCTAGSAGADIIQLQAGTYKITLTAVAAEFANLTGDYDILDSVTIKGAGAGSTIIDGNGAVSEERVFAIYNASSVTFDGVTIQNGYALKHWQGGAIRSFTTTSTITIQNSEIINNTADAFTGGVLSRGALNIFNSTISGNKVVKIAAKGAGSIGGVYAHGAAIIVNSTISGNSAVSKGGGVKVDGGLQMANTTIYGNTATSGNGGLWAQVGGTVQVVTSIIAGNSGAQCAKAATVTWQGDYNLASDTTCKTLSGGANEITDAAFALPGLAINYGGALLTHDPAGTTAVDAVPLQAAPPAPLPPNTCGTTIDQNGNTRNLPAGTNCDIGAVEVPHFTLNVTSSAGGLVAGGTAINCPAALCTETHPKGGTVTLTATAAAGYSFSGWGGACLAFGTTPTCTFTMANDPETVSASFSGLGCTDPAARNYNPAATIDDGSCLYGKARKNKAPIYDPDGNGKHNGDEDWLVFPAPNANESGETIFIWKALTDPEGSEVTYQLYVCKDGDFENCAPIVVTHTNAHYAGALGVLGAGLLIFGLGFTRSGRRSRVALALAALLLSSSGALVACGKSSESDADSNETAATMTCDDVGDDEICQTSLSLEAGFYQWKVVGYDFRGVDRSSGVRDLSVE